MGTIQSFKLNLQDPFGEKRGNFDYGNLLKRLEKLKVKYVDSLSGSDMDGELTDSDHETEVPSSEHDASTGNKNPRGTGNNNNNTDAVNSDSKTSQSVR